MPTLNWIGKKAVVNHHQEVPFHLLKDVPELSIGDPGSGNLIVEGDNLLALKALLPYYSGQVKCIYIDPPYNTGNEGWIYNDNVNSPIIKKWLGKAVGKEAEDLSRHDKWLCMMYPRLKLFKNFLKEDGVIFVSIDDNEITSLRILMDEIFGANNFKGHVHWRRRSNQPNDKTKLIGLVAEHILVYSKNASYLQKVGVGKVPLTGKFSNPDNDPRGDWASKPWKVGTGQSGTRYKITTPSGDVLDEEWMGTEETYNKLVEDNRIIFPRGKGSPRKKYFKFEREEEGQCATNWWTHDVFGSNQNASSELHDILGEKGAFDNPKPTKLVENIISLANVKDGDIVLDSFAGSGTTGHSSLLFNKAGCKCNFILVELESNIAKEVTLKRVKNVIEGYNTPEGESIEGLGGGVRFCTLGEPIFNENGTIRDTIKFGELARHVYFTETGEPLPKERVLNTPHIGTCNGVAIYLLYNGILKDKTPNGGNVLTSSVLAELEEHDGPKVVYGTACRLGTERLRKEGITFKQLPYNLRIDAK